MKTISFETRQQIKKLVNVKNNKDLQIWAEFARRKKQFHPNEDWSKIRLWGLFSWGYVSHLIKKGEILTDMKRENKTIWCKPTPEAYHSHVEHLLTYSVDFLTKLSGWNDQ